MFTKEQYEKIYDGVSYWLCSYTPGENRTKGYLKYNYINVWKPIADLLKTLQEKKALTDQEKDFFELVVYNGTIYRMQNYYPKNRGHICEIEYHQSWSSSIEGLSSVTNYDGNIILIIAQAKNGININGLLGYIYKYNCISRECFSNNINIKRYLDEEEIEHPMLSECITKVMVIDKQNLNKWEEYGELIPKEKWLRKTID